MSEVYDVIVVGGGPAGSAVARWIASAGFRVAILEQHPQVGLPVQCSGLVTPRTLRAAHLDPGIAFGALTGAYVVSPNSTTYEIGGDRVHAYILDRAQFDRHLADQACEAGAEQWLDTRVTDLEYEASQVRISAQKNGITHSFRARLVIGADGPRSIVASFLGLPAVSEMLRARGADVRLPRHLSTDRVHIFTGERYGPGFFAWVIPISGDRYRIGWGIGRAAEQTNPLRALTTGHSEIFGGMEILSQTGGLIPVGPRLRMSGPRGLVVGDAAGQAKATSGGGLYTSLASAEHCAEVAIAALSADDTSAERLYQYDQTWRAGIGQELISALALRDVYRRLTDRELEWALRLLQIPGVQQIVNRHGDIDFPSRLATNALRFAPGLLRLLNGSTTLLDVLSSEVSITTSGSRLRSLTHQFDD